MRFWKAASRNPSQEKPQAADAESRTKAPAGGDDAHDPGRRGAEGAYWAGCRAPACHAQHHGEF